MADKMTLTEAARYLGISRVTMSALVRRGKVKVMTDPIDTRKKLVKLADLDKLKEASQ
jgi:excisionase family DNA binding protein